jgi:rSAM/selenodomain-associated transferase 1
MPWSKGQTLQGVDKPVDKVENSAKSNIFSHSGPILCLFAKQPVPGQVKTRLTPPLTANQACRLYQTALYETVAHLGSSGLPLGICYAGQREWFSEAFPGLPLFPQIGDDLGSRMEQAVRFFFAVGAGPVLLAGSDCPDLPIALLKQVVQQLRENDAAVIPCRDGGYVLVGMRRPVTELFSEIPWSSSRVLAETRRRSRQLGLTLFETESWHDLDEIADLQRLVIRSPGTQTARHVVNELEVLL